MEVSSDGKRPYILIILKDESIFFFEGKNKIWVREEALSDIVFTEFVDLPAKTLLQTHVADDAHVSLVNLLFKRWSLHLTRFSVASLQFFFEIL